jgi:hypothetical protein
MIHTLFIKSLRCRRHIFIKPKKIISIYLIVNPHMIYEKEDLLEGYIILLNSGMKIPTMSIDMSISNYVKRYMKIDKIKEVTLLMVERYDINGITYIIYYAKGNSRYYNTIYDRNATDYIWKDEYIIKYANISGNIYEIEDYKISSKELLNKYRSLLFNI